MNNTNRFYNLYSIIYDYERLCELYLYNYRYSSYNYDNYYCDDEMREASDLLGVQVLLMLIQIRLSPWSSRRALCRITDAILDPRQGTSYITSVGEILNVLFQGGAHDTKGIEFEYFEYCFIL